MNRLLHDTIFEDFPDMRISFLGDRFNIDLLNLESMDHGEEGRIINLSIDTILNELVLIIERESDRSAPAGAVLATSDNDQAVFGVQGDSGIPEAAFRISFARDINDNRVVGVFVIKEAGSDRVVEHIGGIFVADESGSVEVDDGHFGTPLSVCFLDELIIG